MSHWNPSSGRGDPSWVDPSPDDPDSTLYPVPRQETDSDAASPPYGAPPPHGTPSPYPELPSYGGAASDDGAPAPYGAPPPYEHSPYQHPPYGEQPDPYQQPPIWAGRQAPVGQPMWDDPQPPKAYLRQQPAPPGPGRRGKTVIVVAAAVVIIAAVGGALAFALRSHRSHSPALSPTNASSHASHSQGATPSPTNSPSAGRTTPQPTHSPGNATVAVAPAAARNPSAPQVVNLLTKYFTAINSHDYPAYLRLLDPQMQRIETAQRFSEGFRSTTDSGATLAALSTAPDGRLAAVVRFTSRQSPADSPDRSACTHWTITLYLQSGGGGYRIGVPPAGYQASHQAC
jgi:hypothetical protein